ncbi:14220_t:CDS:2, partial [Ambispora leptoticha]
VPDKLLCDPVRSGGLKAKTEESSDASKEGSPATPEKEETETLEETGEKLPEKSASPELSPHTALTFSELIEAVNAASELPLSLEGLGDDEIFEFCRNVSHLPEVAYQTFKNGWARKAFWWESNEE